jgi:AcrR family transcriptional regulator
MGHMTDDLNTVKTISRQQYHHGNLRESLIAAAEEILREHGVARFSLREAARRCGVSPAAPAHHFGDARGLLTAVATRGFQRLADELERDVILTGADHFERLGATYLRFARDDPAIFSIMWATDLLDQSDQAYLSAGRNAFNVLERLVNGRDVAVATAPRLPQAPTLATWALVHGLARLALDGALRSVPPELEREVLALITRLHSSG